MKHMVRCKTLKSLKKTKLLDVSFVCIRPKKNRAEQTIIKERKGIIMVPFVLDILRYLPLTFNSVQFAIIAL